MYLYSNRFDDKSLATSQSFQDFQSRGNGYFLFHSKIDCTRSFYILLVFSNKFLNLNLIFIYIIFSAQSHTIHKAAAKAFCLFYCLSFCCSFTLRKAPILPKISKVLSVIFSTSIFAKS